MSLKYIVLKLNLCFPYRHPEVRKFRGNPHNCCHFIFLNFIRLRCDKISKIQTNELIFFYHLPLQNLSWKIFPSSDMLKVATLRQQIFISKLGKLKPLSTIFCLIFPKYPPLLIGCKDVFVCLSVIV